jgi:hypothetical protein
VIKKLQENNIQGEKSLSEKGFHFLKMQLNDENWYMIFNTDTVVKDEWVELAVPAKSYVFFNPVNGEINLPKSDKNRIRLQLDPEQCLFVKCAKNESKIQPFLYENANSEPLEINGLWKIVFVKGGPVFPGNLQTDELMSWTKTGDEETRRFAGTVRYTTDFHYDKNDKNGILNLGIVKDCAHVKLNGKDFGTLPGPSFKVKVDNLAQGNNILQVEVTNVAANRIRDLDKNGVVWRKFYDINFVDIDYEPFDASDWEIRDAGLLGPVILTSF